MAKRSTRNADGSARYTPRGRHWNDGRAMTGPVRDVRTAVTVMRHEDTLRYLSEIAGRPPRPPGRLTYTPATVWESTQPATSRQRRARRARLAELFVARIQP